MNNNITKKTLDEYEIIMNRIRIDQWAQPVNQDVQNWVNTQLEDGSWSGLPYGPHEDRNVPNIEDHLDRLRDVASAYTNSTSIYFSDLNFKNCVVNGLNFWNNSNTTDGNWWWNEIDFPKKLGYILILMRFDVGSVPESIENTSISLMYDPPYSIVEPHGTGANMLDIGSHFISRGALIRDSILIYEVVDTVAINSGYGSNPQIASIRYDNSFQDHGPQLHISSYGEVFSSGLTDMVKLLETTSFEFDNTQIGPLLEFSALGQVPTIRGSKWDFNVLGRGISRKNNATANSMISQFQSMVNLDSNRIELYQNAIARIQGNQPANFTPPISHTHFWFSDFTNHSTSNYYVSLRLVSTRTAEIETGNGENLKANYFSYGATCIMVDGEEYYNIMPFWDWRKIPGITFKETNENYPPREIWGGNFGKTNFVGGVSSGNYGASTLDFEKDNVSGKKSWFFLKNEIVCLGSAITFTGTTNEAIITSVEQNNGNGDAKISINGTISQIPPGTLGAPPIVYDNPEWVSHHNLSYFFPEPQIVKMDYNLKEGNWTDINIGQPDSIISGDVFSLWIDHGSDLSNGNNYSYTIVPTTEPESYQLRTTTLENSAIIQAVYQPDDDVVQIIFHSSGSLIFDENTITVDAPCALMIENTTIYVADPTQLLDDIGLTILYKGLTLNKRISFPNQEGQKGTTVSVDFQL